MATKPGIASTANPGHVTPVSATMPATTRGPAKAPTWSSALCTAKPRPRPTVRAASASSTDLDGERTALPERSRTTSAEASTRPAPPTKGATARSGTQTTVIAYPVTVHDQYRPDRSARGPENSRNPRAAASPAPVTRPTTSAEAPREARKGPVTDRAPS
jgi:hypothetical protein